MEKPNIKKVLYNKERQFWVFVASLLLRLKLKVDKRLSILYNNLADLEIDKKDE